MYLVNTWIYLIEMSEATFSTSPHLTSAGLIPLHWRQHSTSPSVYKARKGYKNACRIVDARKYSTGEALAETQCITRTKCPRARKCSGKRD